MIQNKPAQEKQSRKSSKPLWRRGKAQTAADASAHDSGAGGTAEPAGHVLRILSGLHVGASRGLAEKEMILVGSGDDCDIVLSDHGVAPHHALVGLMGGAISIRALDAPLRIGGQPLHPGDPVQLSSLQRIELGQAAIAVGDADDGAWSGLLPAHDGMRPGPSPSPYMRHLPTVAAFAVLSLMSVAILAAVLPARDAAPQPTDSLSRLIPEFGIVDGRATVDANGIAVLRGTVKDAATRDRIQQRLRSENVSASLDLRTGEDIASDVHEVLRTQGFATRTRYLGAGDVEVSGNFNDGGALEKAVKSRAMTEVAGVRRVVPRNYEPIDPQGAAKTEARAAEKKKAEVVIVSVVRGKDPHVLGSDGTEFAIGAKLPDGSTLVGIGTEYATALDVNGQLQRVQLAPAPDPNAVAIAEGAVLPWPAVATKTASKAGRPVPQPLASAKAAQRM